MNEPRSFFEGLLYNTVPILVRFPGGVHGSGTGFFYSYQVNEDKKDHYSFLVTNRHVVEGCLGFSFIMKPQIKGKNFLGHEETISLNQDFWIYPEDARIDLAVLEVGKFFNMLADQGRSYHYVYQTQYGIMPDRDADKFLDAVEDVYFPGYPQGLSDKYNNIPLIRKGITSTPYYLPFNGEEKFIIDAEVFPGSSGSPVFLYFPKGHIGKNNEPISGSILLGVLTQSLNENKTGLPLLGLGIVQKAKLLKYFVEDIISKY